MPITVPSKCDVQGAGEKDLCGYFALHTAMEVLGEKSSISPRGLHTHGHCAERLAGKDMNTVLQNTRSKYACTDTVRVVPALRAGLEAVIGFAQYPEVDAAGKSSTVQHWVVVTDYKKDDQGNESVSVLDSADGRVSRQSVVANADGFLFSAEVGAGKSKEIRQYTVKMGKAIVDAETPGLISDQVKTLVGDNKIAATSATPAAPPSCVIQ